MRAIVAIFLILSITPVMAEDVTLDSISASLYFSPKGNCTQAIVGEIDSAKKEVLVQAYSFTSAAIAQSLMNAKKRGVSVRVILDKSQSITQYSVATLLYNQGIPVFIDSIHTIAHDKIMIVDGRLVITGSFNFTKAAEEKNAENVLIVRSTELAKLYTTNWNKHLSHSTEYRK